MTCKSRTDKSLKNVRYALFYYFVNLIVIFFSRKIFIEYLGAEILGLNITITSLLQFLNLAELGIGAAISYSLYEPLAENNHRKVNEIVSLQGYLYARIAFVVIGGACCLLFFFPFFFEKTGLPLWYAYSTFIILLCGSLASYFFNYREIILTADQKDYKITVNIKSISVIKSIMQICAIVYLQFGYIWWLALEFLAIIVTVIMVNRVTKQEYPWLKSTYKEGRIIKQKYPIILQKTKQLFFHKIAGFVLTQTSTLIIYAYASLTLVTIYGNYLLITTGVVALLGALFNSIGAGVGNLVASSNKGHILSVFEELFSCRFLLAGTVCFGVYILSPIFIYFWIGNDYLLDKTSLILVVLIMYINLTRTVIELFINAYGLYNDVWAPVVEAILNIGLSILLGNWWGLHGILGGALISLVLIVLLWKPFFLFEKGFYIPIRKYIQMYIKHLTILFCVWIFVEYISVFFKINPKESCVNFFLYSMLITGVFFFLLMILLYISSKGMKDFVSRIIKLCFNR